MLTNTFQDTPIRCIVDELVIRYPTFKRDQILIWKVGPVFDKPSLTFYEHMNSTTVADILGIRAEMYDPRERYEFNLRYTVFAFEIKAEQSYFQQCAFIVNSEPMVSTIEFYFLILMSYFYSKAKFYLIVIGLSDKPSNIANMVSHSIAKERKSFV